MRTRTLVVAGVAVASAAVIGVAGASLASAGSNPVNQYGYGSSGYEDNGSRRDGGDGRGQHGVGGVGGRLGHGVSGDAAVKVVQAAVAKEPTATVLRLGRADDGTYRVAMRRIDGTHVVLTLDAGFTVTGTQERAPRDRSRAPSPSTPTG